YLRSFPTRRSSDLSGAAYKYIYETNNNCNRAHSQHKAGSEAILNTSHKVLYRQKFSVQQGKPRGGFLTSEARMEVLHKIGRSTVRPFLSLLVSTDRKS